MVDTDKRSEDYLIEPKIQTNQICLPQINFIEVDMYDGAYHEANLVTRGLTGCNGVMIHSQGHDGTNRGILTHYAPTRIGENMVRIERLVSDHPEIREGNIAVRILHWEEVSTIADRLARRVEDLFGGVDQTTLTSYKIETDPTLFGLKIAADPEIGTLYFDVRNGQFEYAQMESGFHPQYNAPIRS